MTNRFADHILTGDHASRPAASAVPVGTLYSCTTHSLVYQSDGASWSTWATLGGGSGTIGGSSGATDNAVVRADGTGGSTIQNSLMTIDDSGSPNIPTGQTYNINGSPHSHAGGGISQSYLGYNTVGGSTETMTVNRAYLKKITLASAGLLAHIDAHVIGTSSADLVNSLACTVYSDNAGTPNLILANANTSQFTSLMDTASGAGGGGELNARWLCSPLGIWLPAADYWIAVMCISGSSRMDIHYDGSGSDHYYTSGGGWFADHGYYSETTSSNKYSIRACILS